MKVLVFDTETTGLPEENNVSILDTYYDLSKNKGYGTAKHMDGIKKYGITQWHRKTFGICNNSNVIDITSL